jgi:hypothetical protein
LVRAVPPGGINHGIFARGFVLQRTQGFSDQVLVETDAGVPLLTSNDFDLNFEPGVSALIGHRVDCVSAWEIGYFGAQQWSKTEVAASLNNGVHWVRLTTSTKPM